MHAMVLKTPGTTLEWTELPDRQPGQGEIRVKVAACGVCRTDLHVLDGELPDPRMPIIPGHEIVGRVDAIGPGVEGLRLGQRVGLPWLGHTCGVCLYCTSGAGEPVRPSAVSRLHARRRFRDRDDRRCAFRVPARRGGRRCRAGAVAVRRADRLAVSGHRRRRPRPGVIRVRRGGAHSGAGGRSIRAAACSRSPAQETRRPKLRPRTGCGMGWRLGRNAAGTARRRDHFRRGRRPGAAGVAGGAQRRPGGLRRHPHERHPGLSLSFVVGGAAARIGRQPDPAGRHRVPGQAPEMGIVTKTTRYRLEQANEALADLRAGRFEGAAVLVP